MIYIRRLCVISDAPMQTIMYAYLRYGCWWLNWVKPDGLPDLFRLKSVGWIILVKG